MNETITIDKDLAAVIKRFMSYSFGPIGWDYTDLTDTEKALATPEQFTKLTQWVKEK